MMKHNWLSPRKILLFTAFTGSVLATGACAAGDLWDRMTGNDDPARERATLERRAPSANPVANGGASAREKPGAKREAPYISPEFNPYDSYDESGNAVKQAPGAADAAKHAEEPGVLDRMGNWLWRSDGPPHATPARKPIPGNPGATQAQPPVEPNPSPPAAVPPQAGQAQETQLPVPQTEGGTWFARLWERGSGDAASAQPASDQANTSQVEGVGHPLLKSVPAVPGQFESIKEERSEEVRRLSDDHASAQTQKEALMSEPHDAQNGSAPPATEPSAPQQVPQQAQVVAQAPSLLDPNTPAEGEIELASVRDETLPAPSEVDAQSAPALPQEEASPPLASEASPPAQQGHYAYPGLRMLENKRHEEAYREDPLPAEPLPVGQQEVPEPETAQDAPAQPHEENEEQLAHVTEEAPPPAAAAEEIVAELPPEAPAVMAREEPALNGTSTAEPAQPEAPAEPIEQAALPVETVAATEAEHEPLPSAPAAPPQDIAEAPQVREEEAAAMPQNTLAADNGLPPPPAAFGQEPVVRLMKPSRYEARRMALHQRRAAN